MPHPPFDFQPVIIIGAARSGTNMLRDMLTQIPGVGTWPCDEINYIWRHHNAGLPHDEFSTACATPRAVRYIRRAFATMARRTSSRWLIEKTCANSLRVGFVDAVVPEAKYIFLVRDGRDVVASAVKRWKARFELRYILKKMRFVPFSDLPYYALRYLGHRLYRLTSPAERLKSWGPRFAGMDEALRTRTLEEVCALQWKRSVEASERALLPLGAGRVHHLTYEEMVANPQSALRRVVAFLNLDVPAARQQEICGSVFAGSVGSWLKQLSPEQVRQVEAVIGSTLTKHGYILGSAARRRAA